MRDARSLNEDLDIHGQVKFLEGVYIHISLCYPFHDDASMSEIVEILSKGLQRLSKNFPWVAGQLLADNEGITKIRPLADTPHFVVRDLRDDPCVPTMDDFRKHNFPMNMLPEEVFASRPTLGPEDPTNPNRVFELQANFLRGGLILTIVYNHAVMDGNGNGQIMQLFSKACRGEEFTAEELSCGNMPRGKLIPLLEDAEYTPGKNLKYQLHQPSGVTSTDQSEESVSSASVTCSWTSFSFSAEALKALKRRAETNLPVGASFVSTDDVLTAFIWKAVARARRQRFRPGTESCYCRAIDVRRFFKIPDMYPGMLYTYTYHEFSLDDLPSASLGHVAASLRDALVPEKIVPDYRSYATTIHRLEDKRRISLAENLDFSKDMQFSSWAKTQAWELDFGMGLGKPEAVRRPRFSPIFEGLSFLLPKSPDGEIIQAICLRDDDISRMRNDPEFMEFAKYVG